MGTFRAERDFDDYRIWEDAPREVVERWEPNQQTISQEFVWYLSDTLDVAPEDLGGFKTTHTASEWHIEAFDYRGEKVGDFFAPGDWHFSRFAYDFWAWADEYDLEYERDDIDY